MMADNSIDLVVTSPPYNKGYYADKKAKQSNVWNNLSGRKIGILKRKQNEDNRKEYDTE